VKRVIACGVVLCLLALPAGIASADFNNPHYDYYKVLDYSPESMVEIYRPEFSPDGTKIVWEEKTTGGDRAVKYSSWDAVTRALGTPTTVASGTYVWRSHWSPDGQYIGYQDLGQGIGQGPGGGYDPDLGEDIQRYRLSDGSVDVIDMPISAEGNSIVDTWNFYGASNAVVYSGLSPDVLYTYTSGDADRALLYGSDGFRLSEPRTFASDTTKVLFYDDDAPTVDQTWSVRILEGGESGSVTTVCSGNLASDGYGFRWAVWGKDQDHIGVVRSFSQGYTNTDTDIELWEYNAGTGAWELAEDLTGDGYTGGTAVHFGSFAPLGSSVPEDSFLFRQGVDMWYAEPAPDPIPDPVPEPISMIFFGTGLVGVFGFVSRRRKIRKS